MRPGKWAERRNASHSQSFRPLEEFWFVVGDQRFFGVGRFAGINAGSMYGQSPVAPHEMALLSDEAAASQVPLGNSENGKLWIFELPRPKDG